MGANTDVSLHKKLNKHPRWAMFKLMFFGDDGYLQTNSMISAELWNRTKKPLALAKFFAMIFKEKVFPFAYQEKSSPSLSPLEERAYLDRTYLDPARFTAQQEQEVRVVKPKHRVLKALLLPLTVPLYLVVQAVSVLVFAPVKFVSNSVKKLWNLLPEKAKSFISSHKILFGILGVLVVAALVFSGFGIAAAAGSVVAAGVLTAVGAALAPVGAAIAKTATFLWNGIAKAFVAAWQGFVALFSAAVAVGGVKVYGNHQRAKKGYIPVPTEEDPQVGGLGKVQTNSSNDLSKASTSSTHGAVTAELSGSPAKAPSAASQSQLVVNRVVVEPAAYTHTLTGLSHS